MIDGCPSLNLANGGHGSGRFRIVPSTCDAVVGRGSLAGRWKRMTASVEEGENHEEEGDNDDRSDRHTDILAILAGRYR